MHVLLARVLLLTSAICLGVLDYATLPAADGPTKSLAFTVQDRVQDQAEQWQIRRRAIDWQPSETCVVVCDMWDSHHSKYAALRCAETRAADE